MSDLSLTQVHEGGVLTLTLNRPATLNALDERLLTSLRTALQSAADNPAVGAVVLAGAGRGFCAGGDLRSAMFNSTDSFERKVDALRAAMECARLLHQMSKPTIAMVRGPAAGAGVALATACDLRIASTTAAFTTAFSKVGLTGDCGIGYFLTRLVGTAKARELMYLSEKVEATEALRIGLVNRVVADDQLEAVTASVAGQLGNGPPVAFRYMKRNLNAAEQCSLDEMLDMEALHLVRASMTEDHGEAVSAFMEKRPPVYRGY